MGFTPSKFSQKQQERVHKSRIWIKRQIYENATNSGLGNKISENDIFIRSIECIYEIFCNSINFANSNRNNLLSTCCIGHLFCHCLDDRETAQVKFPLIEAYIKIEKYECKRFPDFFVLRYCMKKCAVSENSIRPILKDLAKRGLLINERSQLTSFFDCEFTDKLLSIVDEYYRMQQG
jgi:hypothetical protein